MGKNGCQYLKEGALLYAMCLPIDCYGSSYEIDLQVQVLGQRPCSFPEGVSK